MENITFAELKAAYELAEEIKYTRQLIVNGGTDDSGNILDDLSEERKKEVEMALQERDIMQDIQSAIETLFLIHASGIRLKADVDK